MKRKKKKQKTHPSLNFLRRATALFLIIFFTSRPPELSPSLVDPDATVAAAAPAALTLPDASSSSNFPVAALDKRFVMLVNTLLIFAADATAPALAEPATPPPPLECIFSLDTLRKSFPKSLPPSSKSEELLLLRSGETAAATEGTFNASMLVADFRKLPTDA